MARLHTLEVLQPFKNQHHQLGLNAQTVASGRTFHIQFSLVSRVKDGQRWEIAEGCPSYHSFSDMQIRLQRKFLVCRVEGEDVWPLHLPTGLCQLIYQCHFLFSSLPLPNHHKEPRDCSSAEEDRERIKGTMVVFRARTQKLSCKICVLF